jgi:hypothetical protein
MVGRAIVADGSLIAATHTRPMMLLLARTTAGVAVLGLVGVVAMAPLVPNLLRRAAPAGKLPRVPMPALTALALLQTALLVVLCAWVGTRVGEPLGFRSRLFDTVAGGGAPWPALGAPLLASLLAGVGTGMMGGLAVAWYAAPLVGYLRSTPVLARLLYGGLTEEVLMRWGLLPIIVWLLSRIILPLASRSSAGIGPGRAVVLAAVVVTDALFAAGHLPVLHTSRALRAGRAAAAIFVVSLPWGWLCWTLGLEAAMAAHISFHAAVELGARSRVRRMNP